MATLALSQANVMYHDNSGSNDAFGFDFDCERPLLVDGSEDL